MRWKKWIALLAAVAVLAGSRVLPAASMPVFGSEAAEPVAAVPDADEIGGTAGEMPGQGGTEAGSEIQDREEAGDQAESADQEVSGLSAEDVVSEQDSGDIETSGSMADSDDNQEPDLVEAGFMEDWIPVPAGGEAGDNDQTFAAYVDRELELSEDLRTGGDAQITTPRKKSNYASNRLTGANRLVYGILLEEVRRVAKGERTDTRFYIPLEDIGVEALSWTPEELGVSSIITAEDGGNQKISSEAYARVSAILADTFGLSARPVIKALLADCPCDLYWYEKTKTTSYGPGLSFYADGSRLFFKGPLVFYLPVCADYAALDEEGNPMTYEADPSCGTSVTSARERAAAIVEKYRDLPSDYEKLCAYKNEILDLTDYNGAIAGRDYGDPWQLIWVFDGDENTRVVCEGYAKAFQYLCDLTAFQDIFKECLTVTGTMSGEGHMWNIVLLQDGRSYLADLTNCDDGMAGSGNDRSNLFLIGVKESTLVSSTDTDSRLADGSFSEGYTFHPRRGANIRYVYDEDSLLNFSEEDLTLAQGVVTSATTADGSSAITHTHIFITDPAVQATCSAHGLTEGSHCAICGFIQAAQEETDLAPHTPDEDGWTVVLEPTCEQEGVETTHCTVCGAAISRSVDKLIPIPLTDSRVSASLKLPAGGYTYDGSPKRPPVTLCCGAETLTENRDFTVSYRQNVNAGTKTALVTITGAGRYTGTLTRTFSIGRAQQKLRLTASAAGVREGFTAEVTASGAREKAVCTFTSSNPAVASVRSVTGAGTGSGRASAIITGKKAGTAHITVTARETANYRSGSAKVTIRVSALTVPRPLQCRFLKWSDRSYTRCVTGWRGSDGADGYETLQSWTDGSHAVRKQTGAGVLQTDCRVPANHVTQFRVRAFVRLPDGSRKYSQWSNLAYITPSPVSFSCKRNKTSAGRLQAEIKWNIIYGSSGYNIFLSTNPAGTWYWNQSTQVRAGATGAVIRTCGGSRLRKGQRYYVRIVTRRRRNGVFCTVPLPAKTTCAGSFCF